MIKAMQELAHILYSQLLNDCPILSGNMKKHIRIDSIGDNYITYVIDPPYYDVDLWKETKTIVYTSTKSYASSVNDFGGFFTMNKSQYWVNRACVSSCNAIPNASVDNRLKV